MEKKQFLTESQKADASKTLAEVRAQLLILEDKIESLRIQFEQFFSGSLKLPPNKLNQEVQRELRDIQQKTLKNSALSFKARTVKNRYQTLATYWQRVFQARDAGTYAKDVFKADMRERIEQEEQWRQTKGGKAEQVFQELFHSYQNALEQTTGRAQRLDFEDFQRSILRRSRELKQKSGSKKVSFKVVVKDGKVSVQAVAQ